MSKDYRVGKILFEPNGTCSLELSARNDDLTLAVEPCCPGVARLSGRTLTFDRGDVSVRGHIIGRRDGGALVLRDGIMLGRVLENIAR